jgi:mannose-1-phosphate guanylyltransferase
LLGVNDLVVVDSGDAILIARRSRSQDVRRVIDELERRRLTRYL